MAGIHIELKSLLLEITQINTRMRNLSKEVKNSPIQTELRSLRERKKDLTQKCEQYMMTNKLEHVHTVIPPMPQETDVSKSTKTSVRFVSKVQQKFSLDDIEDLLHEYYKSRGIEDETDRILKYFEQSGPVEMKLHVQSRSISNPHHHVSQQGNV